MPEAPNPADQPQSPASPRERSDHLVVIGASAGGVDALLKLVSTLPSEFPAPIVIAQHLDPRRRSHLGEILSHRSALPVRTVTNHVSLEPGTVYVIASDFDVEITDQSLSVRSDAGPSPKPSIDRLLATAARVFTDDLIAVILTGSGTDGAIGAQAVKAHGGTVVVQNPETASFPGMPLAVPPSAIDIVAELGAIGPLLNDLVSGVYAISASDDDGVLTAFLERVRERTGLDFSAYKRPTIVRRLQRRMAAAGTADLRDYRRYLERHPDELQRLVASFLIKVTGFFRDPALFAYLREHVLPGLIAEAHERGELRIWSAGCATGEEAYTLAMIVTELLSDDDRLPVRIFATDIATDAVNFARHGVYSETALEGLSADAIERHFVALDGAFEVRKRVRSLVVFGEHDLANRAPFPRIDLVLCRNVLIYFTPELQRRALQVFAFSLRQGGILALGTSETVSPLPEYFSIEQPRLKVFRRAGAQAPIPADRVLSALPLGRPVSRPVSPALHDRRPSIQRKPNLLREPSFAQHLARVLDHLGTGVVAVDRGYHIRSINNAARRLLNIHTAAIGEDLIHRVTPTLAAPLRAVLDQAWRGAAATSTDHIPDRVADDDGLDVTISAYPVADGDQPQEEVLLEVVDISGLARQLRTETTHRDRLQGLADRQIARTERAVEEVRVLHAANQAMAAEVAKLRAENEELMVANEEAQAASEEIETLNEEMQATNEELETLNEELQATVEELTTTNDELHSRTIESHNLAVAREADRQQLAATLAAMSDAVLVVAADGEVVMTNAAYDRWFGAATNFAPEDDLGHPLPEETWPQSRASNGESFTSPFTLREPDGTRKWYEASGQPLLVDGGKPGGVVVIRDVTDRSLRHLQEQFLSVAGHELRTPLTALSLSLDLAVRRSARVEDEHLRAHLIRAVAQTRRLTELSLELADVARLQSATMQLEREPVDLTSLTRRTIETAQVVAAAQPVLFETEDEPVAVLADARRLEQALLNLFVNAITFSAGQGAIEVRLAANEDMAVIDIRDHGPGIPADDLLRVFERFYRIDGGRSAREGLGLGLFIAQEIVKAHDGSIEAQSQLGDGATFTVRLPLYQPTGHTLPTAVEIRET